MDFYQRLLLKKQVAIWGMGYLGYTFALKLQAAGFKARVIDFNAERYENLKSGNYPTRDQKEIWSQAIELPKLTQSLVEVVKTSSAMFADTPVHIIGFPAEGHGIEKLVSTFIEHRESINKSLILFQAAETPGNIDANVISPLNIAGVKCFIASAFRSDWTINEFFKNEKEQVLAANDDESLNIAGHFFEVIGQKHVSLSSIREAEIYENARNSLHSLIGGYVSQLALGFPHTDIRKMTGLLLRNINTKDIHFRIGSDRYKTAISNEHLVCGAKHPEFLTLIKEAQEASLSLLLSYADVLLRKGMKSILILGLSAVGDQKDLRFSPSIFLAEYLSNKGADVYVHDPFFEEAEIKEIIPFVKPVNLNQVNLTPDAIVIMTDHSCYKSFTQEDLDSKGISQCKIILVNVGVFKNFTFSPSTLYHLVGDGKLDLLEQ